MLLLDRFVMVLRVCLALVSLKISK